MAILIMVIGLYKKYVNFKNGYISSGYINNGYISNGYINIWLY